MAQLIHSLRAVVLKDRLNRAWWRTLVRGCPTLYCLAEFQHQQQGQPALEYDVVILAPHAIFVIEAKECTALTGDDTEWLLNQQPRKCPLW